MSLTVPLSTINATTHESLGSYRERSERLLNYGSKEVLVDSNNLHADVMEHLAEVARKQGDNRVARAVESILQVRSGIFDKPVPNFKAFLPSLKAFLSEQVRDGWIYVRAQDGEIYPELVTSIRYVDDDRTGAPPRVELMTSYYGLSNDYGKSEGLRLTHTRHSFQAADVARKRLPDILAAQGIFKETEELRAEYDKALARHRADVQPHFAAQFRLTGKVYKGENFRMYGLPLEDRRVILDMDDQAYGPVVGHAESELFDTSAGTGPVPEHPVVRVFDLKSHDFIWINSAALERYQYDHSLRDKLILPRSHRDLLDVLTTNLDAFTSDIIEGKSAGNVILTKGPPGVGKTLTAEVYAELIERPLYSIHSGNLGTNAKAIQEALQTIFQRAKRWGCALLLDEADVYVIQRGNSIEQNAIVAEFLRTLEYFDGLMFMTTNRPDDIDDAIISRCAAIIDYSAPDRADASRIWEVMADQQGAKLDPALVEQLLDLFPTIAPRDIKMLLRLALRIAHSESRDLSLEIFRRCAMFRAVKMATGEAGPVATA